jgi:predicted phage terminase large subunit-like protein
MEWSEDEETELLKLLEQEEAKETLTQFMARVSPRLPPPKHIQQIIDVIERTRYEEVRCTISLPPRHAKTTTGIHGLAWKCVDEPHLKNAFISYSANLAHSKSRDIRTRAQQGGAVLDPAARSVAEWRTIQQGGLFAAGVSGSLVGKGITGIAWIDDPLKNREEADSEMVRNKLWSGFNDDLITRLEKGASCIVVATRWHPDDLIGRLHSKEYEHGVWESINIPAVADANGDPADERVLDPQGNLIRGEYRQDVQALWPAEFPLERLAAIRRQIGEYGWWSLYQGLPTPRGASVFNSAPSRFRLADFKLDGHRLIIAVDPAATEGTRADYSVMVVMAAKGYGENMVCNILEVVRIQATIPRVIDRLKDLQAKWRVPVACEAVGGFKAIPDTLRELCPTMVLWPVPLKGDKFSRSQPYAAAWNDGRILLPTDAPWASDWIAEHGNFTGVKDKHDDQVDAGAHAFAALSRMTQERKPRDYSFTEPL